MHSHLQIYRHISPYAYNSFPLVQIENPYLMRSPSVFLFLWVLIWPFWKKISADVHSLNNKADHPPPLPQLTNNKPTVTGILLFFHSPHDVKNIMLWGKKTKLLHLPWKLTLIILSDGFLSHKPSAAYGCSHKGYMMLNPHKHTAAVPQFPYCCLTWCATDTKAALLFLTAIMSHQF